MASGRVPKIDRTLILDSLRAMMPSSRKFLAPHEQSAQSLMAC